MKIRVLLISIGLVYCYGSLSAIIIESAQVKKEEAGKSHQCFSDEMQSTPSFFVKQSPMPGYYYDKQVQEKELLKIKSEIEQSDGSKKIIWLKQIDPDFIGTGIKVQINDQMGIPVEEQQLIVDGKELADDKTIDPSVIQKADF